MERRLHQAGHVLVDLPSPHTSAEFDQIAPALGTSWRDTDDGCQLVIVDPGLYDLYMFGPTNQGRSGRRSAGEGE